MKYFNIRCKKNPHCSRILQLSAWAAVCLFPRLRRSYIHMFDSVGGPGGGFFLTFFTAQGMIWIQLQRCFPQSYDF